MTQAKSNQPASDAAPNPFADLTKLMEQFKFEQFKLPGVDMSALVDAQRKDIEALVTANQTAYEGLQAMARKQAEMLAQAMQSIRDAMSAGTGVGDPTKMAELAREAMQKTFADMRDLAEIARKTQTESMASITQRAQQRMQELQQLFKPK